MPTDIVETIGSGKDYATVAAWKTAHDGEDLVANDERLIGVLYDQETTTTQIYFNAPAHGTVTDSNRYRWLRPATAYDIADDTGPSITRTNGGTPIRIREDFFRFGDCGNGVGLMGLFAASVGSSSQIRAVRVDKQGWVDSIYAENTEGTHTQNIVFQASVGMNTGTLTFSDCIAVGSNNADTAILKGARFGFGLTPTGGTVRVYNCDAKNIRQYKPGGTNFVGSGIVFGNFCEIENCAALNNGNTGSTDRDFIQLSTPVSFQYCLSSDTTASGSNSITSESAADTWVGESSTNFNPKPGTSELINNGVDLSAKWPEGTPLDADSNDHDNDGQGWEIGAYNYDTLLNLTSTIDSESTLSAAADYNWFTASNIGARMNLTGTTLSAHFVAASTINCNTTLTGALFAAWYASSVISSQQTLESGVRFVQLVGASIDAFTTLTASLDQRFRASSSINANTTLSGTLDPRWAASATVSAEMLVNGILAISGNIGLAATIEAYALVTGAIGTCADRTLVLTELDEELLPEVLALLADLGKQITFVEYGVDTYDPATGAATQSTPTNHVVTCSPPLTFSLEYAQNSLRKLGDMRIIAAASGLAFTPSLGMPVTFDDTTWHIENIRKIYTGEIVSAYEFILRGGEIPTLGTNASALDEELVDAALELIEESGKFVTFVVPGLDTYDPATGAVTVAGDTDVIVQVSPPEKHKDTLSQSSMRVFLPTSGNSLAPFRGQVVEIDAKFQAPQDADTLDAQAGSLPAVFTDEAITSTAGQTWAISVHIRKEATSSTKRAYLRPGIEDSGSSFIERFQAIIDPYTGGIDSASTFEGGPYSTSDVTVESVSTLWWKVTCTLTDAAGDGASLRLLIAAWTSTGSPGAASTLILWGAEALDSNSVNVFPDPNDFSLWATTGTADIISNTYASPGALVAVPVENAIVDVKYIYSGEQIALYELLLKGSDAPDSFSVAATELDTEFVSEAYELTQELGKDLQFFARDESYAPGTGNIALASTSSKIYKCTPPEAYSEEFIADGLAKDGDAKTFLPTQGVTTSPILGQRVLIDCEVWTIEEIGLIYSGEQVALYELRIRK